ncbi:hypothetical protein PISMIDRAFT_160745 [Pisolithus microcarpus 441]|uniref:Unplaced genomic scaffold scaffold_109, whole genome shotgun sequence n=1 Tax=Pisolithus microcarpus 441 TaxID=765257 RepID=A0A0C9Z9B5_9AGAM|nr:hypothetical protein BKA83DRAFT_160745 [Pisolithus microcarpus]KIK19017.1 hypothetical protein PISMIDRAFT_160745 [Pisolithus microcarpus 441]
MQISTTFLLLAFTAYVRATCSQCPHTVNGQTFTFACEYKGENYCHYTGGNGEDRPGPLCPYYVRVARPRSISCAQKHLMTSMTALRRICGFPR